MFDSFTDIERRALVIADCYQQIRRETQRGYRCFPKIDEKIKNTPLFKQFLTVVTWLIAEGWSVTWQEAHWVGYVKYVFKSLAPTIPQPGQLKQPLLLKKYIKSVDVVDGSEILDKRELGNLYAKILDDDILSDTVLLKALGIKPNGRRRS